MKFWGFILQYVMKSVSSTSSIHVHSPTRNDKVNFQLIGKYTVRAMFPNL
jgi:hypothetical protein